MLERTRRRRPLADGAHALGRDRARASHPSGPIRVGVNAVRGTKQKSLLEGTAAGRRNKMKTTSFDLRQKKKENKFEES